NGRAGLSALDGAHFQRLDGAKPDLKITTHDSLADTDQADSLRPCSGNRALLTCRGEAARDLRLSRSRAGVNESLAWLGVAVLFGARVDNYEVFSGGQDLLRRD